MTAALQEGIYYAPGNRPGRFFAILFLQAPRDTDVSAVIDVLGQLWQMYQGLKAGRLRDLDGATVPAEQDHMTTLLGIGPKAFMIKGVQTQQRPDGLADINFFRSAYPSGGGPLLRGSGLQYASDVRANPATEEFCIQIIADTKLATNRAVVETWKLLHDLATTTDTPALQMSTFYQGFQRNDHRSWIDFHDGLSNLRSEDRADAITIKEGTDREWVVGGTYLAFLRLGVDLSGWRQLSRTEQELAVGRDKITGCPLTAVSEDHALRTDPACPVGGKPIYDSANDAQFAEPPTVDDPQIRRSHVQRANHHLPPASDPGSRRIFRQGYEFLEWSERSPGFQAGLNFVSFQDTPARLLEMLTQRNWLASTNFGGDQDTHPQLSTLLTVYAAAIYAVPPAIDGEAFPGAAALAPSG